MAITLASLISEIRDLSGLRANQLYTDAQIAQMATDVWLELFDRFVFANQHYRIKTFEFTLAGGVGGNTVTLPEDFQLGNGLELDPTHPRPKSVDYLESWLNRNNLGASVLSGTVGALTAFDRRYCFTDNQLQVYPPDRSQGDYKLYYTPQEKHLQAPVTVSFAIDSSDNPAVPPAGSLAGSGSWALANAFDGVDTDLIDPDGGFDLVLDFGAPNASFSGTYPVVGVGFVPPFGLPTFGVSNLTSTVGFTGPATGTGTYTFQPLGTMSELPAYAAPWALYIKLGTSIAIREARQQDIADLERRWLRQQARVDEALENRQEEPTQPPLTGGRSFWDSL
jgi:hypothetical protein